MLDEAQASGQLKPGGRIVESTSGNTGLGLALLAAERGYRFTAVVDEHASPDKLLAMQAHPLLRAGTLALVVAACGVAYFATLFAVGFRFRDFKRCA